MRRIQINMDIKEAGVMLAILRRAEQALRKELDWFSENDWEADGKKETLLDTLNALHRCRWMIGGLERGLKTKKREG